VVYIGSWDHKMYALDASTGKKLWSYRTGNDVVWSPAVANGEVYVGSVDLKPYAFDLAATLTNQAVPRPRASPLKPNRTLRPSN
jgi:outer membrane protein assembly factor BamB